MRSLILTWLLLPRLALAIDDCPFCSGERAAHVREALEKPAAVHRELNVLPDFPLLETANFWVYITRGAFVPHYLLIASKAHFERVADLPPRLLAELEDVVGELHRYYAYALGTPYVMFEHGPKPGGFAGRGRADCTVEGGGGCVDHLHVHLLPYGGPSLTELLKAGLSRQLGDPLALAPGLSEIRGRVARDRSYIYLRDVDGRAWLYLVRAPIRSQLMRLMVAFGLGIEDEYNWRDFLERGDFVLNSLNTVTAWTLYRRYGTGPAGTRIRCNNLLERHRGT